MALLEWLGNDSWYISIYIYIYDYYYDTRIYLPLYSVFFNSFLLFLSIPFLLYFYYVSGTDKLGGMVDNIAYVFF